jgi:hypothetical protein
VCSLDGEAKEDWVGSFAGDVFEGLRMGILVWLSLRRCPLEGLVDDSRSPFRPLPAKAFPWTAVLRGRPAANGRSRDWTAVGSYSCFCSRANMLLFLTRDCFLRFSMELRLGDSCAGDDSRSNSFSDSKRFLGEMVCSFQNRRGLLLNGELSLVRKIFYATLVAMCRRNARAKHTLEAWLKLGEFLLRSVEPISESGRPLLFVGEAVGVLFMRSGDTCRFPR